MRKLKLSLGALRVESFEVTKDDTARRGTVRGHTGDRWCFTNGPRGIGDECWSWTGCHEYILTESPYDPCNTDEGSCANSC